MRARIEDHFRAVAAASDVPVIAYDLPVSTHVKLTTDIIATLTAEGVIVGLKDFERRRRQHAPDPCSWSRRQSDWPS